MIKYSEIFNARVISTIIIFVDLIFCLIIIHKVSYTEIDWVAYMQEVRHFLNGERNYINIKGDTGPLVYPAGFLYVFSLLFKATDNGENIKLGQQIFGVLYLLTMSITLYLYRKGGKVPILAWLVLMLSKRVHSIFVLRMFNDTVAIFFCYLAMALFVNNKWRYGSLVYSFAVSVKMNILLFAPGLLLVLLVGPGIRETAVCLSLCALIQLGVGYPFLSEYPVEYISRAFEFSRVFLYEWTVNFRFLSEEMFVSKSLSVALLLLTVTVLYLFAKKWMAENWKSVSGCQSKAVRLLGMQGPASLIGLGDLPAHFILTSMFVSNFIGVVFARTLHYQFYSWYFFSLPYLLWQATALPVLLKLLVLLGSEVAFNVYPSTVWSSLLLQGCHILLLLALYVSPAPLIVAATAASNKATAASSKKNIATQNNNNNSSKTSGKYKKKD